MKSSRPAHSPATDGRGAGPAPGPESSSLAIRHTRAIDREALLALYDAVGWTAYTQHPEDFGPMISASWLVLSAWDGSELVGLVRAVGDGVTVAYIQDLLVHPTHQRGGVGRRLLRAALQEMEGIRQVYITTDDDETNRHVVALYRSAGFRPTPELGAITLAIMG